MEKSTIERVETIERALVSLSKMVEIFAEEMNELVISDDDPKLKSFIVYVERFLNEVKSIEA